MKDIIYHFCKVNWDVMVSFISQKPNSLLKEPKTGVLNFCFDKALEDLQITFSAFDPQIWILEIQTWMGLLHNHMTPDLGFHGTMLPIFTIKAQDVAVTFVFSREKHFFTFFS